MDIFSDPLLATAVIHKVAIDEQCGRTRCCGAKVCVNTSCFSAHVGTPVLKYSRSHRFLRRRRRIISKPEVSVRAFRAISDGIVICLNKDPIGEVGGISLYGLTCNDLIDYFDPFGMNRAHANGLAYKRQHATAAGSRCVSPHSWFKVPS